MSTGTSTRPLIETVHRSGPPPPGDPPTPPGGLIDPRNEFRTRTGGGLGTGIRTPGSSGTPTGPLIRTGGRGGRGLRKGHRIRRRPGGSETVNPHRQLAPPPPDHRGGRRRGIGGNGQNMGPLTYYPAIGGGGGGRGGGGRRSPGHRAGLRGRHRGDPGRNDPRGRGPLPRGGGSPDVRSNRATGYLPIDGGVESITTSRTRPPPPPPPTRDRPATITNYWHRTAPSRASPPPPGPRRGLFNISTPLLTSRRRRRRLLLRSSNLTQPSTAPPPPPRPPGPAIPPQTRPGSGRPGFCGGGRSASFGSLLPWHPRTLPKSTSCSTPLSSGNRPPDLPPRTSDSLLP